MVAALEVLNATALLGAVLGAALFLMRDGSATFSPVEIGIAGAEYFEVLSGLAVGDSVVSGPYQRIRQLRNGDAIRVMGADSGEDEG